MHHIHLPSPNKPKSDVERPGQFFAVDLKKFSRTFHRKLNAFVVLVDGYSHYRWIYWIRVPSPKDKHDIFLNDILKGFYLSVCVPNNWLHFTLHPDNAMFFTSNRLKAFCDENGIKFDPSIRYQSDSNGLAEAAIKLLTTDGACNLASSRLPHRVYPYAVNHENQIRNMLPHGADNKSPAFRLEGTLSSPKYMKTFGCQGFIYDQLANHNKLEPPANPARFLHSKVLIFPRLLLLMKLLETLSTSELLTLFSTKQIRRH